jgi:hypothetical protein
VLRGPPCLFLGAAAAAYGGWHGELLIDERARFGGGDGAILQVADRVGLAAGEGEPGPFGEAGRDDAEGFEVVGAALGHLCVVDRGELRVELAGGVRGLDQLSA